MCTGAVSAQGGGLADHLRIGFGAGANSAHIIALSPYNIYEDLTGTAYGNSYSPMLQNIGNQYFVQAEWYNDFLAVVLKPGTYTYRFSKLNEVVFSRETVEQNTPYLLRYLSIPLEVRVRVGLERFRPYAGLSVAYSHMLGSNDASNRTFIRPKITAGGVLGTYIDLAFVVLDLNAGYRTGLHNIASKANRFDTGNGTSYAQDDLLLNDLQLSLSVLFSLQKQNRRGSLKCYY